MKENVVKSKSFEFAIKIVNLYKFLLDEKRETVMSKQILKCGTSIGANIAEADGGTTKAEFKQRISIAYREARETQFWLQLLHGTEYIDDLLFKSMSTDCDELCKILFSILKTSRNT